MTLVRAERESDALPLSVLQGLWEFEKELPALPVTAVPVAAAAVPVGALRVAQEEGEPVREGDCEEDTEGEREDVRVACTEEEADELPVLPQPKLAVGVSVPLSGGREPEAQEEMEAEREEEGVGGPDLDADVLRETLPLAEAEPEMRGEKDVLLVREGEPEMEEEGKEDRLPDADRVMLKVRLPRFEEVMETVTVGELVVLRLLMVPLGVGETETVLFALLWLLVAVTAAGVRVEFNPVAEGLPDWEESPDVARGVADAQAELLTLPLMEALPVAVGEVVENAEEEGDSVPPRAAPALPVAFTVPELVAVMLATAEVAFGEGVGELQPVAVAECVGDAVPSATDRVPEALEAAVPVTEALPLGLGEAEAQGRAESEGFGDVEPEGEAEGLPVAKLDCVEVALSGTRVTVGDKRADRESEGEADTVPVMVGVKVLPALILRVGVEEKVVAPLLVGDMVCVAPPDRDIVTELVGEPLFSAVAEGVPVPPAREAEAVLLAPLLPDPVELAFALPLGQLAEGQPLPVAVGLTVACCEADLVEEGVPVTAVVPVALAQLELVRLASGESEGKEDPVDVGDSV